MLLAIPYTVLRMIHSRRICLRPGSCSPTRSLFFAEMHEIVPTSYIGVQSFKLWNKLFLW